MQRSDLPAARLSPVLPLTPTVSLPHKQCSPLTQSFLPQQELLAESQGQESVLAYLPEDSLREAVRQQWAKQTAKAAKPRKGVEDGGVVSSVERWEVLEEQVQLRVS